MYDDKLNYYSDKNSKLYTAGKNLSRYLQPQTQTHTHTHMYKLAMQRLRMLKTATQKATQQELTAGPGVRKPSATVDVDDSHAIDFATGRGARGWELSS